MLVCLNSYFHNVNKLIYAYYLYDIQIEYLAIFKFKNCYLLIIIIIINCLNSNYAFLLFLTKNYYENFLKLIKIA